MAITPHDIAKMLDHSTLQPFLTEADIRKGCELALKYDCASVCARPCDVPILAEMLKGSDVKVCTVIGFPHGNSPTAAKAYEAKCVAEAGAAEVDMVINRGWVKDGLFDAVTDEIAIVKKACAPALLKVIIECCGLTDEEKIALCKCVTDAGAEYIKTSTGFDKSGATVQDVALMKSNVGEGVLVKAAGGIRSIADAENFIHLGATRLGTSSIVKIVKNEQLGSY